MTEPHLDDGGVAGPVRGADVVALHRRYVLLAGRFKSAWTFHQFLEGLQKVFVDSQLPPYTPGDFKGVYNRLKQVADSLAGVTGEELRNRLDEIDGLERKLYAGLLDQDSKVSTSHQRIFFQRIEAYDHMVLARLVRFYLHAWEMGFWAGDGLDKFDLLATKLAEETTPGAAEPDWLRARGLFDQVASGIERRRSGGRDEIEAALQRLARTREVAARADDIEELRVLIAEHRAFKHELPPLIFEPEVLLEVARANWALRRAVTRVFQREERSIFAESERILELEGRVVLSDEVDEKLSAVRREIAHFEQRVQDQNVRLDEISQLRRNLESLMPHLGDDVAFARERRVEEGGREGERAAERADRRGAPSPEDELLRSDYEELIEALRSVEVGLTPREATLTRAVFPFRLEPREVVAYRRLSEGRECDLRLERFVLVAAALRQRIHREVEGLNALTESTADGGTGADTARLATEMAGDYVHRLSHAIDEAVTQGDLGEARHLQVLRMRLLREAAGVWLMVHRGRLPEILS